MEGEARTGPAALTALEAALDRLGRLVSWASLGMVLVTAGVVAARYGLGAGSIAVQEAVAYLHATLFMLGASYALLHDAHVRVDVLYRGWSPRVRAIVDLAGTALLLLPTCVFAFASSLRYVGESWRIREGSPETGGLPGVFLLKTLIPVMAVTLLLAGLTRAARAWLVLRQRSAR